MDAADKISRKLRKFRKLLSKWDKNNFGNIGKKKKEINKEIRELEGMEEEGNITGEESEILKRMREEINDIY